MTITAFLFALAKGLLPILFRWVAEAQRAGIVTEGEQRTLGLLAAAFVKELGVWDDIQSEIPKKSDADLDDILGGGLRRRKKGEDNGGRPSSGV